MKTTGQLFN